MQVIQLQNESIIEIGTFLVRRWSEEDKMIIEISDKMETRTRLNEKKVIMTPLEKRIGNDFQKYRQFRTSLWYEAMRVKFCKKILSNDHAFGFILNTMETQRIEQLGRKIWKGMDDEIIFNYAYMLVARPQLNTVYGNARIVEAFYQYFMFGAIKGEIQSSHFEKIKKATEFAKKNVNKAIEKNYDTNWLEKNVSEVVKILEIDSLLTIPVSLPFMKSGMALNEEELLKILKIISNSILSGGYSNLIRTGNLLSICGGSSFVPLCVNGFIVAITNQFSFALITSPVDSFNTICFLSSNASSSLSKTSASAELISSK